MEGADDFLGVPGRMVVLLWRAEVANPRRLRRPPPLAVVDPPGMNHDHGRIGRLELVWHLDDPASVVRKPPGPHLEVRSFVIHQQRRFVPRQLLHRLDELRIIGEQRRRVLE